MFSAVRSQHNGVDICINNAGLARPDTLLSGSTSGWKDMFNVRALGWGWGLGEAWEPGVGEPKGCWGQDIQ
jgi:NADP-dependent 3-hydroxy acid dehydrogenase YdfG